MLLSSGRRRWSCRGPSARGARSSDPLVEWRFRGRALPEGVDLLGEVIGVVLDEAEQRRAPGVLPGQPEEVDPRRAGHAALVYDAAAFVEHRHVDPGVVAAEAGRPDDTPNVELAGVAESHRRAGGVDRPAVELDSLAAEAARA